MTIVTMFWGVSPSDVCDWDTKASATDQRTREPGIGLAEPLGREGD